MPALERPDFKGFIVKLGVVARWGAGIAQGGALQSAGFDPGKAGSESEGCVALDAAIISASQKVEHYEITSYGCLVEWANRLEAKAAAGYLNEIPEQEKEADKKLTVLAEDRVNASAEGEEESANGKGSKQSVRTRTASR